MVRIVSITPTETEPDLHLIFAPAPDDPDYRDPRHQEELRGIEKSLAAQGLSVQARMYGQKSATGGSWLTGDFFVHLSALGTPLGALFGAWITAKLGRKIRAKIGDIEVEAANEKQVERLLKKLQEIKAENNKQP